MVKRLAMEELSGIASSIELLETLIINAKQGTPKKKANGLRERVVDNRGAKQGVGYGGPRRGKRYIYIYNEYNRRLLHAYLPYVSETGTVFESWQIGQSCTNLRPPPWTTLGRAPRLCWGIIMPPNLSNLFDSSATIIISI
jgi:hypothetical protein